MMDTDELKSLKAKLRKLEEERLAAEAEVRSTQSKIVLLEKKIEIARQQNDALEDYVDQLSAQISTLKHILGNFIENNPD